jgi:hypothetical protein
MIESPSAGETLGIGASAQVMHDPLNGIAT